MKIFQLHKQESKENKDSPNVGIFWVIPASVIDIEQCLLYVEQTLVEAAHADIFYDSTFEHYAVWDTIQKMFPKLKNTPYEKYPRGRVTFVAKNYPNDGTFKLMADAKILQQRECLFEIKRIFNMKNYKIEVRHDAHYRT